MTHGPPGPWWRPGVADVVFAIAALTQIGPRVLSTDTPWHLWAGEQTLAHGPGMIEALSYTRAGTPWRNVEWLGEVLLQLAWRHAGALGLCVLAAVTFALALAALDRLLVRGARHATLALIVTLLAAGVLGLHLLARPLLFTFPLLVLARALVTGPMTDAKRIALPLVTAVWVNVHPTAFLVPVLGLWALADHARDRRTALAVALSVLALGATPWGFGWLKDALPARGEAGSYAWIDEWRRPDFRQVRFFPLLLWIAVTVLARIRARPLPPATWLLGAVCVAAALVSGRAAPLAAIVWAPELARDLAERDWARGGPLGAFEHWLGPRELAARTGAWIAALALALLLFAPGLGGAFPRAAAGFPDNTWPNRALAEADRLQLGRDVFCEYGWSAYVAWASRGRYRVYVYGRTGLFAGPVLDDYARAAHLEPGWEDALDRTRAQWILVRRRTRLARVAPLSGRWRIAYADPTAIILVRAGS
ncbi:MAG TPA: hypothetical protein VFK69_00895 [Candidatus Eisenbacteria bacterium]|nr:hypothetical protein [Candidatus Eisenbacteria bacterium]